MKKTRTNYEYLKVINLFKEKKVAFEDNYYVILTKINNDEDIEFKIFTRDIPGQLSKYKAGLIKKRKDNKQTIEQFITDWIPAGEFDKHNIFELDYDEVKNRLQD